MTTRKYKKLLMSEGIDRNLAECARKSYAIFLSYLDTRNVKESMQDYKRQAEGLRDSFGGHLRGKRIRVAQRHSV